MHGPRSALFLASLACLVALSLAGEGVPFGSFLYSSGDTDVIHSTELNTNFYISVRHHYNDTWSFYARYSSTYFICRAHLSLESSTSGGRNLTFSVQPYYSYGYNSAHRARAANICRTNNIKLIYRHSSLWEVYRPSTVSGQTADYSGWLKWSCGSGVTCAQGSTCTTSFTGQPGVVGLCRCADGYEGDAEPFSGGGCLAACTPPARRKYGECCTPGDDETCCERGRFGPDCSIVCEAPNRMAEGRCCNATTHYGAQCLECPGLTDDDGGRGRLPCSGHGECDDSSGECRCDGGRAGDACEVECAAPNFVVTPPAGGRACCAAGTHFGPLCEECPGLGADGRACSGHGSCGVTTGACACESGWHGDACSRHCPVPQFFAGGQCVSECPTAAPVRYRGECLAECPAGHVRVRNAEGGCELTAESYCSSTAPTASGRPCVPGFSHLGAGLDPSRAFSNALTGVRMFDARFRQDGRPLLTDDGRFERPVGVAVAQPADAYLEQTASNYSSEEALAEMQHVSLSVSTSTAVPLVGGRVFSSSEAAFRTVTDMLGASMTVFARSFRFVSTTATLDTAAVEPNAAYLARLRASLVTLESAVAFVRQAGMVVTRVSTGLVVRKFVAVSSDYAQSVSADEVRRRATLSAGLVVVTDGATAADASESAAQSCFSNHSTHTFYSKGYADDALPVVDAAAGETLAERFSSLVAESSRHPRVIWRGVSPQSEVFRRHLAPGELAMLQRAERAVIEADLPLAADFFSNASAGAAPANRTRPQCLDASSNGQPPDEGGPGSLGGGGGGGSGGEVAVATGVIFALLLVASLVYSCYIHDQLVKKLKAAREGKNLSH